MTAHPKAGPRCTRRRAGRLVGTRSLRTVVVAAALALVALVPTAAPATAAPAAPAVLTKDCPASRPVATVTIASTPPVPGARLTIDGRSVVLDASGAAVVRTCRITDARVVQGPSTPVALSGKRRAVFDRVFVADRGRRLEVVFGVEHQVTMSFVGLPDRQITSYTLRSGTGSVTTYQRIEPIWLLGERVVRGAGGLQTRPLSYTLESVVVHGESVVTRSKVRFYPEDRQVVRVQLLAFTADVYVVDRLFRFPVGSRVTLRGDDGQTYSAPLRNGRARFEQVPRNSYQVVAEAPGLRVARNVVLSQNQVIALPVITWLDLLVLMGGPAALALALVLAPRPDLRRRIARTTAATLRGARLRIPPGGPAAWVAAGRAGLLWPRAALRSRSARAAVDVQPLVGADLQPHNLELVTVDVRDRSIQAPVAGTDLLVAAAVGGDATAVRLVPLPTQHDSGATAALPDDGPGTAVRTEVEAQPAPTPVVAPETMPLRLGAILRRLMTARYPDPQEPPRTADDGGPTGETWDTTTSAGADRPRGSWEVTGPRPAASSTGGTDGTRRPAGPVVSASGPAASPAGTPAASPAGGAGVDGRAERPRPVRPASRTVVPTASGHPASPAEGISVPDPQEAGRP